MIELRDDPIPLVRELVHDSSLPDPQPPRKLDGAADGGVVFLDGVAAALAVVLVDASAEGWPIPSAASLFEGLMVALLSTDEAVIERSCRCSIEVVTSRAAGEVDEVMLKSENPDSIDSGRL